MTRFGQFLVLDSTLLLCLVGPALLADDLATDKRSDKPPSLAPPTAKELAEKRMKFMKTALARYTIQVGEEKEPAKVADPCLRWSNPINGDPDGIVSVYAHKGGRPAAIGQFMLNVEKKWCHEFTIIPESEVTILRSGRLFWKPSEYVCKFADLSRAPVPADKAALRLTQMRGLAADFSVTDYFKGTKQKLRLLRQPVYRYSEEGAILDGAIFIFVLGTDPECCMLVEAYKDYKGLHYRYAVAPMTTFQLEVRDKDRLVWKIEERPYAGAKSRAFYAGVYVPEPGEILPEGK